MLSRTAAIALLLTAWSAPAVASQLELRPLGHALSDLTLSLPPSPTGTVATPAGLRPQLEISGEFKRASWQLLFQQWKSDEVLQLQDSGRFKVKAALTGTETQISFTAVGPLGEVESQSFVIHYSEWQSFHASVRQKPASLAFSLAPSLGVSSIRYTETGQPAFTLTALTGRLALQGPILPPFVDLSANVFCTLLPIQSSRSDLSVRFFGGNLRLGYVLPWLRDPWRVSLFGGIYYATMFVTGNQFGYSNLIYPQLYPSIRRRLSDQDGIYAYLKLVPIGEGFSLSLAQHEIATGIGWERALSGGKTLLISADVADLEFVAQNRHTSRSYTASVGLAL